MKRPLVWLAVVFSVLFGILTFVRARRKGEDASAPAANAENVRSFWQTYQRATRARMSGDYESGARAYREALEMDPKHQDSLFFLAACLEATGHYAEAAGVLRQLTTMYPDHARGWSQLGRVLSSRAPGAVFDPDAADAALRRAEELNPEHSGPFVARGLLALESGRLEDASELFAVAARVGAPEGIFYAGLTDYLRGRRRKAAASFRRVLGLAEHERKLTGKGIASEGDVSGERLSPLERAWLRSRVLLRWATGESIETGLSERRFDTVLLLKDEAACGVWLDYDRDGLLDLALGGPSGTTLLKNTGRSWVDVSAETGLDRAPGARSLAAADLDGNGFTDLYLTGEASALFLNAGGRFKDETEAFGLGGSRQTFRVLAADLDADGATDLLEVGAPPVRLYLRRGGRFDRETLPFPAYGVDAAVGDVDGDGRADFFVLGWRAPGRLFRGTASGFQDVTAEAGLDGVGGDGLSTLLFDFDRDGDLDLLVTAHAPLELSLRRLVEPKLTLPNGTPRLFANDGSGHFAEVTEDAGLDRPFGVVRAVAADVDSDGWVDLVLALGGVERYHLEPSVVLRNEAGTGFVTWAYLPSADEPRRALDVAVADVDSDGHAEIFLSGTGILRWPE